MTIDETVLVDTGPLIALYNASDPNHHQCVSVTEVLPLGKALTCWPVITEAAYLLRRYPAQRRALLDAVREGDLTLLPLGRSDIVPIQAVFGKYHDQEVDLADATLVHLAEREDVRCVFTLDRRHFRVFRRLNGSPFRLLPDDLD